MFCDLVDVPAIRDSKQKMISLPQDGGVYKWWCPYEQLCVFLEQMGFGHQMEEIKKYIEKLTFNDTEYYCFYVGKTEEKKGLKGRIKGQHIGKYGKKDPLFGRAIRASTLRQSINALKNGSQIFDENYVDDVLNKCCVQWAAIKDPKEIDIIEKQEINSHIRILNLDDFDDNDHEFGQIRKELKGSLSKKRKTKLCDC